MKLLNVKFVNAVMFEGNQVMFLNNERVELEAKGGLILITNKEQIAVPLSNVVCMKVDKEAK